VNSSTAPPDTAETVRLAKEYLRAMDATLAGSPTDEEVLDRVRRLPGGIRDAIKLIGVGLPAAFRPDLAAGEVGTVAFLLDAEGEQLELHVELTPGRCRLVPPAAQPATIIQMPAATFLKVAFQQLDGNDAYMDGLVVVDGDIVLATGFGQWFDGPHEGLVARVQELGLTEELPLWLRQPSHAG
jgi:hypothetical protein